MQPNYPQQYPPQHPPQHPPQPAYPPYPNILVTQPSYPAPAPYPAQYPAAPAGSPLPPSAPGSLDGFYGQPTAGFPSWKFQNKPMGTTYAGVVARAITDTDVRQQTNNAGIPQTYRDGRPKFILVVPMLVQGSPEFPEGQAGWWVKGQARDELVRAMAEAGAPAGPPEAGAMVQVTLVGQRPIPGMNPAYQYRIVYTRPTGAPPAVAAMAVPNVVGAPVMAGHPGAPTGYVSGVAPTAEPQYAAQQYAAPPVPPVPPVYAPPAPQYAPPVPLAPAPEQYAPVAAAPGLAGLTPEQQALMAQLTGQPVA